MVRTVKRVPTHHVAPLIDGVDGSESKQRPGIDRSDLTPDQQKTMAHTVDNVPAAMSPRA